MNVSLQSLAPSSYTNFGSLISVLLRNAFVIAGVVALVFLVLGGFGVIMGAGAGDTKKLEKNKQTIVSAVIGLVLIVGAFWIVQIIGKLTGLNLLNPGF